MKSIKQIADDLGIEKQRVYRFIKKNCISEVHHRNGTLYCDDAVESVVKQHFLKNSASSDVHHTTSSDAVTDAVETVEKQHFFEKTTSGDVHHTASSDAVTDAVLEMLQKELEIKNKQIEVLTVALENTTDSLRAAQALHAGTMQKQLSDGGVQPEPRGVFSRWLQRKRPL